MIKWIIGASGGGGWIIALVASLVSAGGAAWFAYDYTAAKCSAAREEATQASNDALTAAIAKTDEQLREERAENIRINNLLDIEAETANEMAANFQEEINGIRTNTQVNPDCPPVRYDGVRQLLLDASRGHPADPTDEPAADTP